MNKKFSMNFSKKVMGVKSVYIHVLHELLKFGGNRIKNKKEVKNIFRDRVGPFKHSDVHLLTLLLKMAELGVF